MKSTVNLYLKTMYLLEKQYSKIRVTDIADRLGFTKSSVSKALIRLNRNGYINYETYGDIILSSEAKTIAESLLIKEDLLELFFVGMLNVNKEIVEKDINVISEYVSEETNIALKKYIKDTLHLNDSFCKCNVDKPECKKCETKQMKDRIITNEKWLDILKEEE